MSKETTAVTIIAAIQLIVMVLLYNKMEAIESDVALETIPRQMQMNHSVPVQVAVPIHSGDTTAYVPEERIRQIIQEELRAELKHLSRSDQPPVTAISASSLDAAELEYQRDHVSQQIDYYSSVGIISDLEMQQLQMEIAKLDATNRNEVLSQLIRALNSGRLDGRL